MGHARAGVSIGLAALLAACAGAVATGGDASFPLPAYLARAHSHNDYDRRRPLLDALERGFASVEVDIVLLDGELYVAHEPGEVRASDTLERLYLDPLREMVLRNEGRVFASPHPPLQLLIDVKSAADETYLALDEQLATYADVFTRWTPAGPATGPVTAVLSGARAIDLVLADTLRFVALDGRADDDRVAVSVDAMPLVSVDWETLGPEDGRLAQARTLTELVHREGRKIRFYGTPDREAVWSSLVSIGADYIGTDDNARLERALPGL